jgi:hypothetical protein
MRLGLGWGLDKMMMTLVELSVLDFGKKKILGIMWCSPLIGGRLILLPREIRVIPPPRIVCLRIWPTRRLLKVVESIHLFHLKNCHRWTILCLVQRTSTDRTTLNRECVYSIYRLSYTQRVQSFHNGVHPLSQLLLAF